VQLVGLDGYARAHCSSEWPLLRRERIRFDSVARDEHDYVLAVRAMRHDVKGTSTLRNPLACATL
jgi:hypothetical protein